MERLFDLTEPLIVAATRMIENFLGYLPQLIGGIFLILLGWIVAISFRAITTRLAGGLDRVFDATKLGKGLIKETTAATIGSVVYWIILLFFATSAASVLGLTMFTTWLDRLIIQIPNILAGALFLISGFVFGNIARNTIIAALKTTQRQQREIIGRAAQMTVLIIMATIAADQIGIDITIVVAVVAITLGGLFFGLALAFGLGFRTVAGNLIATRYLRNELSIGDTIKIGDFEGQIIEITFASVALHSATGKVIIPARQFSEQTCIVLDKDLNNA